MLFAQKQGRNMLNNLSLSNTYIQCDLWWATIPVMIIKVWGMVQHRQQRIGLFVIYIWRCLLHNAGFWFPLGGSMTVQLTVVEAWTHFMHIDHLMQDVSEGWGAQNGMSLSSVAQIDITSIFYQVMSIGHMTGWGSVSLQTSVQYKRMTCSAGSADFMTNGSHPTELNLCIRSGNTFRDMIPTENSFKNHASFCFYFWIYCCFCKSTFYNYETQK